MQEKIKEVQAYLEKKGFAVTETAIIDMAIDLARRLGAGDWTFACEAEARKDKAEEDTDTLVAGIAATLKKTSEVVEDE